jgi:hypothetical protein
MFQSYDRFIIKSRENGVRSQPRQGLVPFGVPLVLLDRYVLLNGIVRFAVYRNEGLIVGMRQSFPIMGRKNLPSAQRIDRSSVVLTVRSPKSSLQVPVVAPAGTVLRVRLVAASDAGYSWPGERYRDLKGLKRQGFPRYSSAENCSRRFLERSRGWSTRQVRQSEVAGRFTMLCGASMREQSVLHTAGDAGGLVKCTKGRIK